METRRAWHAMPVLGRRVSIVLFLGIAGRASAQQCCDDPAGLNPSATLSCLSGSPVCLSGPAPFVCQPNDWEMVELTFNQADMQWSN